MMISPEIKNQLTSIWDKYIADHKKVFSNKGAEFDNINEKRIEAIVTLKTFIHAFNSGTIDISVFKTNVDSFNKKNNFWGFTAVKGQMFFNLLLKTIENDVQQQKLTILLKECIAEPKDLNDALNKIETFGKYTSNIFNAAADKRKAPNPSSVCYFLSYFWQIHNNQKWPILYSSIIVALTDIGLWVEPSAIKETYNVFFKLNEEIKNLLTIHSGNPVSNWDVEHALWNFRKVSASPIPVDKPKVSLIKTIEEQTITTLKVASFRIFDYIPPLCANLIEVGKETETPGSTKGAKFEKSVCEIFKQLGFDVKSLGQGTGREPDLIAIYKTDNVAFIVDAKAYSNGYMLSAGDERAIREYISNYCPILQKEGIKKIGFIIVSNSFKPGFDNFINEITWKTDIKRFVLLTSDALLHLLAYKIKDQLPVNDIIESLIGSGNEISAHNLIEKFDDV